MPVEIKELVIKAVAQEDRTDRADSPAAVPDNDEIVESCVREVLRILRKAQER